MKKLKRLPKFKSEKQERAFWLKADSTEYFDYDKAENWVFPNLKLTTKSISIRLPVALLDRLKIMAHAQDMPYQTLVKQTLYKSVTLQ